MEKETTVTFDLMKEIINPRFEAYMDGAHPGWNDPDGDPVGKASLREGFTMGFLAALNMLCKLPTQSMMEILYSFAARMAEEEEEEEGGE